MAARTLMHKCPVKGCNDAVPRSKLMCPPHWELVPAWLKRLVYIEFRKGRLSQEHIDAMDGATKAVDELLAQNPNAKPNRKGPR
jgi:hypothetical protein